MARNDPTGILDPRSKLAVFVTACFSVFSGLSYIQEISLLALCVFTTLLCRKWKWAFYTGVLFLAMLLSDLYMVPHLTGVSRNIMTAICHVFRFSPPSVCVLLSYYKDNENWRIYIRTYQNAHAVRGCNTTGGNVPFCSHDSGGMANGKSGTPPEGAGMELAQCFDSTCPYVGVYDGSFFDAMLRCCG